MAIFDEKEFSVEKNNGVATISYKDEDAFKNGTEIPFAEMKRTFSYAHDYQEEGMLDVAKQAEEIMSKDKSIEKVVGELPYGVSKRGSMAISVNRKRTYPGMVRDGVKLPDTVKSTVNVIVQDAATKISRTKIKEAESTLTKSLLS